MSNELSPNTRDQQFLAAVLDELRELNKSIKGLAKAGPSSSKAKGGKKKPKAPAKKEAKDSGSGIR